MLTRLRDEDEFNFPSGMWPAVKRMAHLLFGQFCLHGTAALGSGMQVVRFADDANSSSQCFRNGAFIPGKAVLQSTSSWDQQWCLSSGQPY